MDVSLFDYELPESCIASQPTARRDESRLLVVRRAKTTAGDVEISHHVFRELPDLLPAGTVLFRNNARVLRARLRGERPTGGQVECLLLRPAGAANEWWCLLKPGKKAAAAGGFGVRGVFHAEVVGRGADGEGAGGSAGEYRVRFELPAGETVFSVSEKIGVLPLPPYIERARKEQGGAVPAVPAAVSSPADFDALDRERYQTVYADPKRAVAAAAPTAGLHFSPAVLDALARRGFPTFDLTLHVGLGTFQPIKSATIEEHAIHREFYELPAATVAALAPAGGKTRLAVGTTSLRAMEDFWRKRAARNSDCGATDGAENDAADGAAICDEAGLFIYPPAQFLGAEALLTNFHLPRSTLMCLVAAFLTPGSAAGIALLQRLYAEAIAAGYRFYSYGDAMLIL
jgi:S-adenosylmethionine:tRNA ribosyltransferase-isomerase